MSDRALLDVVIADPPGAVITSRLLKLSADHGAMIKPRVTLDGTRFPLPAGFMRGSGELIVSAEEGGTRVRLVGVPPPWPLSAGWAGRILRRYVGFGLPSGIITPRPS